MYPLEALKRRYIVQAWRDTAIRHGFEEVDGPVFEHAELYAVKSGEGILGELFQAFSGKSPEEVEAVRQSGRGPYALRPEFTPTLARMYAARAASLPQPTKWFSIGPRFRAERPQRGRLREFLQWDVDILGCAQDDRPPDERLARLDAEVIACCCDAVGLVAAGLERHRRKWRVAVSHREVMEQLLTRRLHVPPASVGRVFELIDGMRGGDYDELRTGAARLGLSDEQFHRLWHLGEHAVELDLPWRDARAALLGSLGTTDPADGDVLRPFEVLRASLGGAQLNTVTAFDLRVVRGLAYYTGMVFELIAEGERSIAGGGRYDGLVELLGGPPTPAVGFAMGDVVLSMLLEEQGLMPEGEALLEAVSRPPASARPDVFVVPASAELDEHVEPLVAGLRRGVERQAWLARADRKPWDADRYEVVPLHARRSYRATRNVGKLLKDAAQQCARYAYIVEGPDHGRLRKLATGQETRVSREEVGRLVAGGPGRA